MQMLKVVLGLAFVAMAAAAGCNRLDVFKVKSQWNQAYDTDLERTIVGRHIFESLFRRFPETQALFKNVGGLYTNSPAFKAQCLRILGALDYLISNLDDEPVFNSLVAHLAAQHSSRDGVKPEYFAEIGKDISAVIREEVRYFDEEAFSDCYQKISGGLQAGKGKARRYYRRY